MYKFHHNKIVNIMSNVAVYSAVSVVITCSIIIIASVVNGNTPTSFGIYG